MKTTFQYDHYYKYDEIKNNLEYFAKTYPELVKLEVNAVTLEGRNQYVVTLTNQKTGDALKKPGWYLDGNIHAGEVTASMCAMHTIDYLLTNYESDLTCQKLLDTMSVYVIPRVTPDGAETYLTTPYHLRSVNQEYLPEKGGIHPEDLDGDGVFRMMRMKTPYGAWKTEDGEKMIPRLPSDDEGVFYDIYPEGLLEECGENLKQKKADWGLDFNRNFPYGWFSDARQPGAGPYPLSNIETKAIVDFVLAHPNIGGAAIGHTSGGIILYPPGTRPEKSAPAHDAKILRQIAQMGQKALGYPPLNIFDSFMDDQENYDSGALDDWFYQCQGIPAYTMEFWDVATRAGVPYEWGNRKMEDTADQVKRINAIMDWTKENAPQYYMPWKEIDHPSLGKVEVGGLNTKYTIQNPPEDLLVNECENDTAFNIAFMKAMPHLVVDSVCAKQIGEGVYQIDAVIGNLGYLSTNLTEEAKKLKVNKPVEVCLSGCEIVYGDDVVQLGDLDGYAKTATGSYYGNITTYANGNAKKKATWIVKGKPGDEITVCAQQEKAGCTTGTVKL